MSYNRNSSNGANDGFDFNDNVDTRSFGRTADTRNIGFKTDTDIDNGISFKTKPDVGRSAGARKGADNKIRRESADAEPPLTVKSLEKIHERAMAHHAKRSENAPKRQERKNQAKNAFFDKVPERFKNASELQVRLRTGAIYISITTICTLIGALPMTLMLMVTAGICANEFYYMLRQDAKLPNELLGISAAVMYPLSMYLAGLAGCMLVSLVFLIALLVWYVFWMRARVPDVGVSFLGAAYTGLLISGTLYIRLSIDGIWGGVAALIIFLSLWVNDGCAYLVGSKFGRHKLTPRISPKKSWEGFIGGLAGGTLLWIPMMFIPGVSLNLPKAIIFGLVCGLMGVLGDLAESRIKRNSGMKDSGTIMPGHGGLLDRCDSLFLAAPASAVLLFAFGCLPYPSF